MNFAIYAHSTFPHHCVYEVTELERHLVNRISMTSACSLQWTSGYKVVQSNEAISLHRSTTEGFSNTKIKPLHHELRARRSLRGFSDNQWSLFHSQLKLRLAMTNEGEVELHG